MALLTDIELQKRTINLFFQFLNEDTELYEQIQSNLADGISRLVLSITDFDRISTRFAFRLLNNPLLYLPACEEGYRKLVESILNSRIGAENVNPAGLRSRLLTDPHLGIKDWLGTHTVTPRGLRARLVNKLICVEGIITRSSIVQPKLYRSVHLAEESSFIITCDHFDSASLLKDAVLSRNRGIPKVDKDGHPLKMEVALSQYKDFQRLTIQEMPESAPTGQLPRSVEVILEDDLVDSAKPGDRARLFGVYRAVALRNSSVLTGLTRSFLICNNLQHLRQDVVTPDITPLDIRMIRELAARPDIFEVLSSSIAPAICGHMRTKKGLLLQQLGGERKVVEGGMKIRGDIHILLIGDPSCGKSQMLRFMMNLAPLSLSTTGRGSSGVGLTAAVSTDKDTGERKLEAGAMVLADGGLVCIDEFDKMSYEDRVAIHEVMEQQTVSISKAGIQTTLNSRCSVLAAANPVYGSFDPDVNLKSQIAFPDSLLTRFDLIFIIRDAQNAEEDRHICSQVLRQLQHRMAGTPMLGSAAEGNLAGTALALAGGGGSGVGSSVLQAGSAHGAVDAEWGVVQPPVEKVVKHGDARYWISLMGPDYNTSGTSKDKDYGANRVLTVDFLRKYLHYAKYGRKPPRLGDEAVESIATFYANLRQMIVDRNSRNQHGATKSNRAQILPTARTLEACVRLATAHAKLKLKDVVDESDAAVARELLLFTLLGEIPEEFAAPPPPALAPPADPRSRRRLLRRPIKAAISALAADAVSDNPERSSVASRKRRRSASAPEDRPDTTKRPSTTTSSQAQGPSQMVDGRSDIDSAAVAAATTPIGPSGPRSRRTATSSLDEQSGVIDENEVAESILAAATRTPAGPRSMYRHEGLHDLSSQGSIESIESQSTEIVASQMNPKRLKLLTRLLGDIQSSLPSDSIGLKPLLSQINAKLTARQQSFSRAEFQSGLSRLQSENKLMIVHGEVWFI